MTNKEFQNILAQYPDEYIIQMDNAFGWEIPSSKHKVDPHLYINTDFGFIEIEPPEIRDLWVDPKEQLPEDGQECIICKMLNDDTQWNQNVIYHKDINSFTDWDYFNDCEEQIPIDEVEAYIAIPKFEKQ